MDYLYDGSFEGFLTCVYMHYYKKKATDICVESKYLPNLLAEPFLVETDAEKAMKVYDAIEEKISPFDLRRVYRAFLSVVDNKEMKLLNYIRMGFAKGSEISLLHGNPYVFDVQSAEKKVSMEVHRLAGLVRFSVLEGEILYSPIEPDNDVAELLAPHFSDRFKWDPFIIHDKGRDKALIASGGNWYISHFTDADLPALSESEQNYRRLWKLYFENIAIKERTNPRCQKNFMPVRYWKNLTEMIE